MSDSNTHPEQYAFSKALLKWFDQHGRKDLPWQYNKTAYRVWVSEIMLQQTQVTTVIPYYQRFMQQFPTVIDLANAEQDAVLHLWTGLGYYARARNLHKAAQQVRDNYAGEFPLSLEEMKSLPGIGRSTAAAILSIAHDQAEVILDGNVKRVLGRYFAVDGWPGNKKVEDKMWQMAQSLKPQARFGDYTQAIMDLGATLCTRSKPRCEVCPVVSNCLAYAQGAQSAFPHKKPKKDIPTKSTIMLVPFYKGSVYLQKRPPSGIWGGLFGFVECHDNSLDSAILELLTQMGQPEACSVLTQCKTLDAFTHTFSHFHLHITPVLVPLENITSRVQEGDEIWFDISNPPNVGLAAPTVKILKQLPDFL